MNPIGTNPSFDTKLNDLTQKYGLIVKNGELKSASRLEVAWEKIKGLWGEDRTKNVQLKVYELINDNRDQLLKDWKQPNLQNPLVINLAKKAGIVSSIEKPKDEKEIKKLIGVILREAFSKNDSIAAAQSGTKPPLPPRIIKVNASEVNVPRNVVQQKAFIPKNKEQNVDDEEKDKAKDQPEQDTASSGDADFFKEETSSQQALLPNEEPSPPINVPDFHVPMADLKSQHDIHFVENSLSTPLIVAFQPTTLSESPPSSPNSASLNEEAAEKASIPDSPAKLSATSLSASPSPAELKKGFGISNDRFEALSQQWDINKQLGPPRSYRENKKLLQNELFKEGTPQQIKEFLTNKRVNQNSGFPFFDQSKTFNSFSEIFWKENSEAFELFFEGIDIQDAKKQWGKFNEFKNSVEELNIFFRQLSDNPIKEDAFSLGIAQTTNSLWIGDNSRSIILWFDPKNKTINFKINQDSITWENMNVPQREKFINLVAAAKNHIEKTKIENKTTVTPPLSPKTEADSPLVIESKKMFQDLNANWKSPQKGAFENNKKLLQDMLFTSTATNDEIKKFLESKKINPQIGPIFYDASGNLNSTAKKFLDLKPEAFKVFFANVDKAQKLIAEKELPNELQTSLEDLDAFFKPKVAKEKIEGFTGLDQTRVLVGISKTSQSLWIQDTGGFFDYYSGMSLWINTDKKVTFRIDQQILTWDKMTPDQRKRVTDLVEGAKRLQGNFEAQEKTYYFYNAINSPEGMNDLIHYLEANPQDISFINSEIRIKCNNRLLDNWTVWNEEQRRLYAECRDKLFEASYIYEGIIPTNAGTPPGAPSVKPSSMPSPTVGALQPSSSIDSNVSNKVEGKQLPFVDGVFNAKLLPKLGTVSLNEVLDCYYPGYQPRTFAKELQDYSVSAECQEHKKTARIFYVGEEHSPEDALRIIYQREPTNLVMMSRYNSDKLEETFGYKFGVYNSDPTTALRLKDNQPFNSNPSPVAVYSKTFLWPNEKAGKGKREVGVLSLPAPALDIKTQPDFKHYVDEDGNLKAEKYQESIHALFSMVKKASEIKDFGEKGKEEGFESIILSKFGQNNFLKGITNQEEKKRANEIFKNELNNFLDFANERQLRVVMSEYSQTDEPWMENTIYGDILESADDRCLVVNAWDPHSAPGNGNDRDTSFDGAMGKGSGILVTQTSWMNENLRSPNALIQI
jgi:hypothetical protein